MVYESLGKPVKDEKSGVIEQPLVRKSFLVPFDGKEVTLKLDGKKTLAVHLSTTSASGQNRIKIAPEDALEKDQAK